MEEKKVTISQMKAALTELVGSKFPIKITSREGKTMLRYIRGFADQQSDVLLISESSFSLALKIIEVKDIQKLEYVPEGQSGNWRRLRAKWIRSSGKPLTVFLALIALLIHL